MFPHILTFRVRYCGCFGLGDFIRPIEGIEVIAGILSDCIALASLVARKKSSAGCFLGSDFAVPEVVGIIRNAPLTIPDIRFRVKT
jgi:hypothetical protein